MNNFKAIILAGGSGERFWPLSTAEHPKQFLRIFGGDSLLRQSVTRLLGIAKAKDIYVVTAQALVAATRREVRELPRANVIGEPMRRDTGAAIALGVGMADDGKDPILGFFSSDQFANDVAKFQKTLTAAIRLAAKSKSIVTIGIKPNYPATQFGYVNPKTGSFVEKPNMLKARAYLKRGYLWNAGMFIGRASVFQAAFAEHAPKLLPLTASVSPRSLHRLYATLPKISFDYAVMEKLKCVKVVKGDFGWDDVGSYSAFDKYFPHDARGNVREGPCTVVESEGNICVARSARISLLGVKNLVVVTTPNYVLVVDKARLSEMKKLFTSRGDF